MTYEIDRDGTVTLGARRVPVPRTVSEAARAYLSAPPWGDAPMPAEPVPMWHMREPFDAQMQQFSSALAQRMPVQIEEMEIAGVRCHMVRPDDVPAENNGKLLVNFHGGGFVLGSGSLVEAIPIAVAARLPVIAVDYRLAPEHPFPAAVDDAVAVYRAVLDHHAPAQVGLYGSSAGGFIVGQTIMRLRAEGLPLPGCCGIFTAGGDLDDLGDSAQIFTLSGFYGEHILPTNDAISEINAYLAGADRADPLVSPIRGDLAGFPPVILMSGTRDALLSASSTFHRALRRAGVEAELYVFEAMPHAHWYMVDLPEAQEAIDTQAAFFLRHLGSKKG